MALTLYYHPLSSFVQKVLIALYEKDLAFETNLVNFGDAGAREAFTALWPTAKIPLLRDGERIVPETSIMIEYLDQHHPGARQMLPRADEARLEARLMDRLFDLYVMVPMQHAVGNRMRPEHQRDSQTAAAAASTLRVAYGLFEKRLAGRKWAIGEEFSIADCAAAPSLFFAAAVEPFAKGHPVLSAYFERLLQRPSVKRAFAEARRYLNLFPLKDSLEPRFLG